MKIAKIFDGETHIDTTHIHGLNDLRIANRVYGKPRLTAEVWAVDPDNGPQKKTMYRIFNGKVTKI